MTLIAAPHAITIEVRADILDDLERITEPKQHRRMDGVLQDSIVHQRPQRSVRVRAKGDVGGALSPSSRTRGSALFINYRTGYRFDVDTRAAVQAGMEVLSWEYDLATWKSLQTRRRVYLRRRGIAEQYFLSGLVHLKIPWSGELEDHPDGRVVFTSTGVLLGESAHLWRSGWWQLNETFLVSGGCKALVIRFIHRWGVGGRKVVIPLPGEVEEHVVEMVDRVLVPKSVDQKPLEIIAADDCDLDLFDPATADDPVARKTAWTPVKLGGWPSRTHRLVPIRHDRWELRGSLLRGRRVFDKREGYFSIGMTPLADKQPLHRIHALQLISEVILFQTDRVSWELNLVLGDGSRLNLVDYCDWQVILAEAYELARFLDVPLWKGV